MSLGEFPILPFKRHPELRPQHVRTLLQLVENRWAALDAERLEHEPSAYAVTLLAEQEALTEIKEILWRKL